MSDKLMAEKRPGNLASPALREAVIADWLRHQIAQQLGVSADEIDITLPFSFYGLDSVAAIGLSGDMQDWLGRSLSPTLTWDYPTIAQLAQFLAA